MKTEILQNAIIKVLGYKLDFDMIYAKMGECKNFKKLKTNKEIIDAAIKHGVNYLNK